ncbi:MAG: ATP-binding cassette domain-containing protein, partial [Verrucomicrobiota bacterium]
MSGLVLEKLSKTFRVRKTADLSALQELSLSIEAHELIALVGPSGCGKTTTLRLIAGLENATSGSIHLDGQRIDHLPARERDVALVFQQPALFPH